MASFSLLLVDRDATPLADALERLVPGLSVTACTSLVAARAHLTGSTFGAVLAEYDMPDGAALSMLELSVTVPPLWIRAHTELRAEEASGAGAMGIVAARDARVLGPFVAWNAGLSEVASAPAETDPEPPTPEASARDLERVRGELGRITHALNNPLAVISGNAQLSRELIATTPGDPMVASSLADIETAAGEFGALIEEINELRRSLAPPPPQVG